MKRLKNKSKGKQSSEDDMPLGLGMLLLSPGLGTGILVFCTYFGKHKNRIINASFESIWNAVIIMSAVILIILVSQGLAKNKKGKNSHKECNNGLKSIKKQLKQIGREMPCFKKITRKCLKQMHEIEELQKQQRSLIELNEAIYLDKTITVLEHAKNEVYQNCQSIINLCTANEESEYLRQKVQQLVRSNKKKLNEVKELLKVSADWVNQFNSENNLSYRNDVEDWTVVIRKFLNDNQQ